MGRVARADADCDDYARHEGDVGSRPRVRANTHLCASWTCGPPSAGPRGGRTARKPPSRWWLTVTGTARTSAAHAEWRLIVKVSPKSVRFFGLFNERNVRLNVHTYNHEDARDGAQHEMIFRRANAALGRENTLTRHFFTHPCPVAACGGVREMRITGCREWQSCSLSCNKTDRFDSDRRLSRSGKYRHSAAK